MSWVFDQGPNVACIASSLVMAGQPILVVTHYEDDHSWAFLDGGDFDPDQAMVVAMSEVLNIHPSIAEIATLPAGWSAHRNAVNDAWVSTQDDWGDEA